MPFSFFEHTSFSNEEINKETFINYLKTGGLPELLHITSEEIQRHYVDSLKNTIMLRDIVERQNIKDVSLLENLFRFLTINIGNLTSISSIVNYFKNKQRKTNYETLSSYIAYLTDTFILHKVDRFNLRGKQVLGGECKYYLNDLSFKNYLFGFLPSDVGYNLENYVFNQLKRLGYQLSVGVLNNLEIDFIAQKPEKILYVQVCYLLSSQEVIDREFGNLLLIKDNHEKIVVSLDDVKFSDYKGIKHVRPWELQ
jgi:predicted AAA+ superfamily ATPase